MFIPLCEMLCLNSPTDVLILCLVVPHNRHTSMTNVLIVVALAGVGAYLVRRVLRASSDTRGIDVGALSHGWIAEHRREEPR